MPERSETKEDIPKLVASITLMMPRVTFRTGWAFLKMKKRAQRMSATAEREMVNNGLPPEFARRLALEIETEWSIRNIARSIGGTTAWRK